jgi:murein DD-endopeptidase MepM/ murein hydrolase activator NlpD
MDVLARVFVACGLLAVPAAARAQPSGPPPTRAAAGDDAGYGLPLDRRWFTADGLRRAHHDHPAIDVPVPIGTPVYAVRGGQVAYTRDPHCGRGLRVMGTDGYEYVYCHGSRLDVADGQTVATGARIMLSGNTATVAWPHLHFGVREPDGGRELCPQPLLLAWYAGSMTPPSRGTRSAGCIQRARTWARRSASHRARYVRRWRTRRR